MKRRLPTIIFSLLVLMMVFTGCRVSRLLSLFVNLEGYWRYEQLPYQYGAGFVHIAQEGDQITMRSITETSYVFEESFTIEEPGLVRSDEVFFQNGIMLLSGEILPEGTYTVINKQVADITDNEIKIFQEFDYILHEGVEKRLTVDNIRWFNVVRPMTYEETKFVMIKVTHPDFSLMTFCHNSNDPHVVSGSAFIDQTHVGTVIF